MEKFPKKHINLISKKNYTKNRRRLEPLFEEETESDEEKTQQESEELKKVGHL